MEGQWEMQDRTGYRGGIWRLVLTRYRHDRESPQVLPLDATHRLADIYLHGLGAEYSGNGRIHD